MDLIEISRTLLVVPVAPTKYHEIRPHHVVLGYAAYRFLASTSVVKKLSESILSWLSKFTEACIPLIHFGLIPDFLIRFGIRIQLYDHLNILKADNVFGGFQ